MASDRHSAAVRLSSINS